MSRSILVLISFLFSLFVFLAACGDYTPQGDCADCDNAGNPALMNWSDCNDDDCGNGCDDDDCNDSDSDADADNECTAEEIAVAMANIPDCPADTYHNLHTECVDGNYVVDATCVPMESEPFDCIGAWTLADALCDGDLEFQCDVSGFVSSACNGECPSSAEAAASCENGLASYSCTDEGYFVECMDAVTDPAVLPCSPTFAEAAAGCLYGLTSYSCDGSTGTPTVVCADAPEETSECPDADDVADMCVDGVSTYECSADGDVSVTCASGETDDDPDTETGACDDGIDNDGEGLTDTDDPDCHSDYDASNPATYDASREEDLYDAGGEYSCCLDMNLDGRCTYTDGSGDVDGTSYSGSDLWTHFNVHGSTYDVCDEWPDGEDDRTDQDGSNGAYTAGDCNDQDGTVYSGATDVCDGYDNDCDGLIDETADVDGDGYADPGCSATGNDCDDSAAGTHPGAIDYPSDSVDQDCSGTADDYDYDGDCYCDEDSASCNSSSNILCSSLAVGDCNDYAATTYPGATDYLGDGYDADCDGIDG